MHTRILLATTVLMSCPVEPREQSHASHEPPPPQEPHPPIAEPSTGVARALEGVEFSGCRALERDGRCRIDTATITAWFPAPRTVTPTVLVGGRPVDVTPRRVQDGWQLVVPVRGRDDKLTVLARGEGEEGTAAWSLPLVLWRRPAVLREVDRLRSGGRFEAALKRLSGSDTCQASERSRVLCDGLAARVLLRMGRSQRAIEAFRKTIEAGARLGMVSQEVKDRCALSYALRSASRFDEATSVLEPVRDLQSVYPQGSVYRSYHFALATIDYGDARTALKLLYDTLARAERMGMALDREHAVDRLIDLLLRLGRFDDAHPLVRELRAGVPPDPGCPRADALTNIGYYLNVLHEQGRPTTGPAGDGGAQPESRALLEQAVVGYRDHCPAPKDLARALMYLAQAELLAGRLARAEAHLAEAQRVDPEPFPVDRMDLSHLRAKLDLVKSNAKAALARYEQLARLASAQGAPTAIWRAAVGRGQALFAMNRLEQAADAFLRAEDELERRLIVVPLGEGRDVYASAHAESAQQLIDVLLRLGRVSEASAAARRSRRRALAVLQWGSRVARLGPARRTRWYEALARYRKLRRQLEGQAENDWHLPRRALRKAHARRERTRQLLNREAELAMSLLAVEPSRRVRRPDDGEVMLVYHAAPGGLVGFAVTSEATTYTRIPAVGPQDPPSVLSQRLLAPFSLEIEAADVVSLLPDGRLLEIDFHALPFGTAPLIVSKPVQYVMDVPWRPSSPHERSGAVVVGDPSRDLPAARVEAAEVAEVLGGAGLRVRRLLGREATFLNVSTALSDPPEILHFSGHATFAGRDGQSGGLPLAEDAWMSIMDVLALSAAPTFVFLSGCETARAAGQPVTGLGLAQAFLLSGARVVVAAARPVADGAARTIVKEIYASSEGARSEPLERAVRKVQVELWKREKGLDWSVFRILKP